MSDSQITVSAAQFAQMLKQKYPQHASAADDRLIHAFVQKNPQYRVTLEGTVPVSVSWNRPAPAPLMRAEQTVAAAESEPAPASGKQCVVCGVALPALAKFCPECGGSQIPANEPVNVHSTSVTDNEEERRPAPAPASTGGGESPSSVEPQSQSPAPATAVDHPTEKTAGMAMPSIYGLGTGGNTQQPKAGRKLKVFGIAAASLLVCAVGLYFGRHRVADFQNPADRSEAQQQLRASDSQGGIRGGESKEEVISRMAELGFRSGGCKPRNHAPTFVDCVLTRDDEILAGSFYSNKLQRLNYKFKAWRFSQVLSRTKEVYGEPRGVPAGPDCVRQCDPSYSWSIGRSGDVGEGIDLLQTTDGKYGVASFVLNTKENMSHHLELPFPFPSAETAAQRSEADAEAKKQASVDEQLTSRAAAGKTEETHPTVTVEEFKWIPVSNPYSTWTVVEALVANSSSRTVENVAIDWDAVDESGTIIQQSSVIINSIPPQSRVKVQHNGPQVHPARLRILRVRQF